MFNNPAPSVTTSAPGAFRGQTFNTHNRRQPMMRSPNKVYQLAAIQFPSAGRLVVASTFRQLQPHLGDRIQEHAGRTSSWQPARHCLPVMLEAVFRWADSPMGQGAGDPINNARINSCETAKPSSARLPNRSAAVRRGNLR